MPTISASSVRALMTDISVCLTALVQLPKLRKADHLLLVQIASKYSNAVAKAAYNGSGEYTCEEDVYRELKAVYFDISRMCLGYQLEGVKKRWHEVVAHSAISAGHVDFKVLTPMWGAAESAFRSTIPDDDTEKATKFMMFKTHVANIKTIEGALDKVGPTLAIAVRSDTKSRWAVVVVTFLLCAIFLTALPAIRGSLAGEIAKRCGNVATKWLNFVTATNNTAETSAKAK